MSRLAAAVVIVVAVARPAAGDTGAWNGFRALGVPDAQLAALGFVTADAMRQGGLVGDVVTDEAIAARCGVEVQCHCEALRARHVRYGGFGSLGHLGDLWTIELTLVDAHGCTVAATAYASESLTDAEVAPRLASLARKLATPEAEVAETATAGRERPIDATPAIVTTFTRAQLRALQIRTLDDLLPFVPGFDVVDANWGGLILNQGLANTLLFLSDGIPLVNNMTNFRWLGRDFRTSFAHVDRIEVVRGPGAVLWGQNAFLGVINLITDTPTRREAAVDAGITGGSLDTEEVWARAEQNRGSYAFTASVDVGRRVGAQTRVADSPQAVIGVSPPVPFGNGGTADPEPDYWFDAMVRIALRDRIVLTIQNLTSDVAFEISPRGPLLDPGQGGWWRKTHRLYGLVANQPVWDAPGASVVLRAQASRYEYYSQENFSVQPLWPDGPAPPPGGRDLRDGLRSLQGNDRPRTANQLDVRAIYDYDCGYQSHLTAGLGVLRLHAPDSLATLTGILEDPVVPNVSFGRKTFYTLSAYAYEELVPMRGLVLSAGARVQADKRYGGADAPETPWQFTPSFQGGAAFVRGRFGGKLIYAEGFRPPDANSLYSTVGTKGNPELEAEYSRELAAEVHVEPIAAIGLRAGGNLTRLSNVIVLDPIVGDPNFAYTPINKGRIDIASAFVEARVTALRDVDGFASYHATWIDESDPLGTGIPIARHTAAIAAVWRPLAALSVFARGAVASPRRLTELTAAGPVPVKTDPTIRSAVGLSITDVFRGVDLDLMIDNPLLVEHDAPYQVDGATAGLVERRRGTEVLATIRYER
jgi:hypothetical protein